MDKKASVEVTEVPLSPDDTAPKGDPSTDKKDFAEPSAERKSQEVKKLLVHF